MNEAALNQDKQDLKAYAKSAGKNLEKKLKSKLKAQIRNKILVFIFTNPITYIVLGVIIIVILVYAIVNQNKNVDVPIADVCEQRNLEPAECKKVLEDEQLAKWLERGNI